MASTKSFVMIAVLAGSVGCESVGEIERGSEPYLEYHLDRPLLTQGCAGDADGDCLDDDMEAALAAQMAPMLFLHERESCGTGPYEVRPFFQVRPIGDAERPVDAWRPDALEPMVVRITFFLAWPVDCGWWLETSHLGDSERVRYTLASNDLRSWSIVQATYDAHGKPSVIDGARLDDLADAIGATRPSIAVEENKHGSWSGLRPDSDHCAGAADDLQMGTADCFGRSWRDAYRARAYRLLRPTAAHNIGEPPVGDEGARFLAPAVETEVQGGHVRYRVASQRDPSAKELNELRGTEYWWNAPERFSRFCGWTCPDDLRDAAGACTRPVLPTSDGEKSFGRGCADPLEVKIDVTPSRFRGVASAPFAPIALSVDERSAR